MKKNKKVIILICIGFILIFCGCFNLFKRNSDIKRNNEIKENLNKNIKIEEEEKVIDDYSGITDSISVDFSYLKSLNPDVIGYIRVNNTNIDYVVVHGEDNNYYLEHNYLDEESYAGWVFADFRDRFDGTDKNIIIYGHNMRDGSMFGTLKNVLSSEWYENDENLLIPLITENEKMVFKVFSVYQIETEDYYIQTEFVNNQYIAFLSVIKSRSIYKFDTKVDVEKSILTLSTCSDSGYERTVLHAVRVA